MPKVIDYTLERIEIPAHTIIAHPWFRGWCHLSYEDNPEGCPNCERCENEYGNFDTVFDLSNYKKVHAYKYYSDKTDPGIWLIIRPFRFAHWSKKMASEHFNEWTQKQVENSRYWQNGLMGILNRDCDEICRLNAGYTKLRIPEATGVNLFSTCRLNGFKLEKNPKSIVNKMMMVGLKKGMRAVSLMNWFDEWRKEKTKEVKQ